MLWALKCGSRVRSAAQLLSETPSLAAHSLHSSSVHPPRNSGQGYKKAALRQHGKEDFAINTTNAQLMNSTKFSVL